MSDTPNNIETTEKLPPASVEEENSVYQCFFGPPVNNSKEETEKLILQEGFSGTYNLQVFESHCFVRFKSKSEFESFIQHFNGFSYTDASNKEVKMFAQESKKRLEDVPPSTRLVISGFGRKKPTERELYFLFCPFGYIKHISLHPKHAFIDFETVEDAVNVLKEMTKEGSSFHFSINYSSEAPNTNWENVIMPLTDLLPNDHPFWQQLLNTLQGKPRPY